MATVFCERGQLVVHSRVDLTKLHKQITAAGEPADLGSGKDERMIWPVMDDDPISSSLF